MSFVCFVTRVSERLARARQSFLLAFLLVLLFGVPQHSVGQNCGGDHQRACCVLDQGPTGCQSGTTLVNGCPAQDSQFSTDCECTVNIAGNWVFSGSYTASSCETISDCGHDGQRACCVGENGVPVGGCFSGAVPVDGCSGDNCYCSSGAKSSSSCVTLTACGGAGQRACCVLENATLSSEYAGGACDFGSGLQQVPGCDESTGNCTCSSGFKSLGTCVQTTHCGGVGERACCTGNGEYAGGNGNNSCESGLAAIPGCSGDCTCGGILASSGLPSTLVSIDTCTKTPIETIPEPSVAATGEGVSVTDPLRGFADLHVHMFAHLAHGGTVVAGTPYDPSCAPNTTCGGVNTALREDYGTNQIVVNNKNTSQEMTLKTSDCNAYLNGLGSSQDSSINSAVCGDSHIFHGGHGMNTLTGGGTNDAAGSNFGAPVFNGWPQANSTIHQQVYYKWLERAWTGGLRLITMFAVTNEALCKTNYQLQGTDCTDSMAPIDAQISAAWAFQAWLDSQYGGAGKGWFRIVTSPQQAASVIQSGKLAVVLGIEVDNLFNCHRGADIGNPYEPTVGLPAQYNGTCTQAYIDERVQHYYDLGVRHVFPIHNFDNAYGSPAAWQDPINVGNRAGEGSYWATENCANDSKNASGYGFWLNPFIEGVAAIAGFGITTQPVYDCGLNADGSTPGPIIGCSNIVTGYGSCNSNGLTNLGEYLIQQLMAHQMIIDVDHLSAKSLDRALTLAEGNQYAGIVASHVQFFDLYKTQYNPPNTGNYGRHERMRTADQLDRIKNLGGMIAVMLKDDAQDTGNGFCASSFGLNTLCSAPVIAAGPQTGGKFTNGNYGTTNNNCRYSTSEWYQAYRKGVDQMGGPVAMGSDFNGIAGHVGPRFGSAACGGDGTERSAQEKAATLSSSDPNYRSRLQYPFTVPGFGQFGYQVSGERTFDFNKDGLAHIGMLPDMLADLYNIDPDADLEPLFHSAKAYVDMWSKIAPAAASQFVVTSPATAVAGISFQITVTAGDSYGNAASSYAGMVHFTSSDGSAVLPADSTLTNGSGTFNVTLNTAGGQTVTATDTSNSSITGSSNSITVEQPPIITSANNTTFAVGTAGSFTETASGSPALFTFSESGTLPSGVTFTNGVFSGTPAAGTGGVYHLTLGASNGVSPNATQAFTLIVDQAPAITSGNSATFTVGTAGSLTVTATGYPAPTFSETGALPSGVSLNSNGSLSGIAAAGTGGVYTTTITANNGVAPAATQSFTLTVKEHPVITSASSTTFTTGVAGSFTATASGYPAPTFSETGALPSGITLSSAGVLGGTPAAGTGGSYTITIAANNGILPNATQSFTLIVDQPPAITSGNTKVFLVGSAGSFTVTATGYPAPTFSVTGTLPSGLTFTSAGVLSGTPAANTGSSYPITITASNGVSPNATQSFTVIVDQPPAITSVNNTAFTMGSAGSFTVTTTGYPAPTFTETGALPAGVTLSSSGVLSGIPAKATGGNYPITITASNGVSPNASQSFTLHVYDFTIAASPLSQTISSGHTASYAITLTSLGGLTGNVALSCSGAPAHSTCTVSPSPLMLNGTAKTMVTLNASMSVNHGTFTLIFTGNIGTLTHSVPVSLTVK